MKISNSPYLFFSFNAIIVFVIGVLFYKLLKLNNINYKLLIFIICFFNELASLHGVELPITQTVYDVIHKKITKQEAIKQLFDRTNIYEF